VLALHRRNGAWETRLALWTDCVQKAPHNGRAHLILGSVYHDLGDYDRAVREHHLALDKDGRVRPEIEADIQKKLGAVLNDAGRPQEAIAPLRRSLELAPEDPATLAILATSLVLSGDRVGAEAAAARAIEVDPGHGPALSILGRLLVERGDAEGALPLLARAAASDPDSPVPHINLVFAYARLDRVVETCDQTRRTLQLALTRAQRIQMEKVAALAQCR
jgi:Flp pilus assembly protein TadD